MLFKVPGGDVVIARPGDRDEARLGGMLALLMAATGAGENPAIIGEQAKEIANSQAGVCTVHGPLSTRHVRRALAWKVRRPLHLRRLRCLIAA